MDNVLPLRDIHLPAEVSAWPPAIGWWLLAVLVLALAVWAILHYRRNRVRRAALAGLRTIQEDFAQHGDRQRLASEVSTLLRRVCLSYRPRRRIASLTGDAWRDALDRITRASGRFSDAVAQQLCAAPYDPAAAVQADALLDETRRWVRSLPPLGRAA